MLQVIFSINKLEISRFKRYSCLIGKSKKNVLAGAHKTFERRQHAYMYLPALKAQYEGKMEIDNISLWPPLHEPGLTINPGWLASPGQPVYE